MTRALKRKRTYHNRLSADRAYQSPREDRNFACLPSRARVARCKNRGSVILEIKTTTTTTTPHSPPLSSSPTSIRLSMLHNENSAASYFRSNENQWHTAVKHFRAQEPRRWSCLKFEYKHQSFWRWCAPDSRRANARVQGELCGLSARKWRWKLGAWPLGVPTPRCIDRRLSLSLAPVSRGAVLCGTSPLGRRLEGGVPQNHSAAYLRSLTLSSGDKKDWERGDSSDVRREGNSLTDSNNCKLQIRLDSLYG